MTTRTTSFIGFVARAKALTRHGQLITVEANENVRGMSDNGQPAWSPYAGTKFKTLEEVKALVPHLGMTDSQELVPDTIEYFRVETVTIITVEEYKLT